ncbi:unnamed protein product [Vitrella brassicaformis CCMP3155]|uniref:diphthine methyl ester synthase n=1 Tax=Vitrella brassicaformis (strain CCMP3155) TaxID=1169540 RepID=A0A0G4FH43_VITBC|nr:unnamed protein product [Vitrella brassicaformis CCMP3155]|mmetsp:Transcript_53582/g.134845  ORF Transcript_53582/g.134845 Transcript_53582/m.134845 type:complete len:276 (-) Transcript_53582:35-862(-)|eukprot:CEM12609.1 unnamed protein product [Vitrella brassicaformis CCMP3155]
MVLHVIGLGLGDEKDVTIKGLEKIKAADFVYLEIYTAVLGVKKETLEAYYGQPIIEADRTLVESGCEEMLQRAKEHRVAFLVVGDPFCATTHSDLMLRAKEMDVRVDVVHNASIMNAVGICGLQMYRFGETVSIPFFEDSWRPESFYDKMVANQRMGLHTLCLLDIKVKEQTLQNMLRGNQIFEAPRFMTVNQAVDEILEVHEKRQELAQPVRGFGLARLGSDSQMIAAGTFEELRTFDFGGPLHSLVLCCPDTSLHELEMQFFDFFRTHHSLAG